MRQTHIPRLNVTRNCRRVPFSSAVQSIDRLPPMIEILAPNFISVSHVRTVPSQVCTLLFNPITATTVHCERRCTPIFRANRNEVVRTSNKTIRPKQRRKNQGTRRVNFLKSRAVQFPWNFARRNANTLYTLYPDRAIRRSINRLTRSTSRPVAS